MLIVPSSDSTPCDARRCCVSQCRDLQEKPNPLVLARLALADRVRAASAATANDDDAENTGNGSDRDVSSSANQHNRRTLTLDLGACRLTDRELRVLLHVLSDERVADNSTAGAGAGAGVGAGVAAPGEATATTGPVRFSALLLGGNPGIGAGALGALWGCGRSGGGGNRSGSQRGLFAFLVRLDLSRCGLTAADLAGLSSANGDGGVVSGSNQVSAAAVCLRALVLRDNPLTRVRKAGRGGGGGIEAGRGAPQWAEPARRGVDALRDLIARAPALQVLDVSGEETFQVSPRGLWSVEIADLTVPARF